MIKSYNVTAREGCPPLTKEPWQALESFLKLVSGVIMNHWNDCIGVACTVFISPTDQGLTLRAWPNHSGGRHSDAVLGPLFQSLHQRLLFTGRHSRLLHRFPFFPSTFWWADHLVAHPIPRQETILTLQRRGAPTYQEGGGAGAAALNVLRGSWGLWWGGKDRKEGRKEGLGRGRGEGRMGKEEGKEGEKQKNKKMGEIKKMKKRKIQNSNNKTRRIIQRNLQHKDRGKMCKKKIMSTEEAYEWTTAQACEIMSQDGIWFLFGHASLCCVLLRHF